MMQKLPLKNLTEEKLKTEEKLANYEKHNQSWVGYLDRKDKIKDELDDIKKNINSTKDIIKSFGEEWTDTADYIANNKGLSSATNSVKVLGTAYAETAEKVDTKTNEIIGKMGDLKNAYKDALADRTDTINKSIGLFDEVKSSAWSKKDEDGNSMFSIKNLYESAETLKDNLAGQVEMMEQYSQDMDDLGKRNISKGLIDELRSMGIGAANEIYALNHLTDEQLNEYDKLWQDKTKLATELATKELNGLKAETEKATKRA